MGVQMPSVSIPLSGRVTGRAAEPSRTRVGDGGGFGCLLENMIGCLGFLHRGSIYRRRGDARGRPGGPQVRPRGAARWRLEPWGSPPSVLRVPSLFHIGNNSCKLSAQYFSETKR